MQMYKNGNIRRKLRVPTSEREGELSNPRRRAARAMHRENLQKFTEIYAGAMQHFWLVIGTVQEYQYTTENCNIQPAFTQVQESTFESTLVLTNRSTVALRNAISNILCSDPANDPNYPPASCIQSIIEIDSDAVFRLRSGVFDKIRASSADEAEF
jgi:hypothetical protein